MADPPLFLDTGSLPHHPCDWDVALAASYEGRCGGRLAFADAIRSQGCTSCFRGIVDSHGGGVYVRRVGPLGGQVEHDLIGSPNACLNSAILSLFPIVMGAIGIIPRTLSPRVALIAGALISCLGMALLIVAVNFRDLVIYLLATAAAGGAYSLLFVGGLQVISAAAPVNHRGGILSALYLLGYLSMGALALVLGAIATTRGLGFAVNLGAAAIILMNVATLVLATTTPSAAPPSPT
jgi:hypothetical protein